MSKNPESNSALDCSDLDLSPDRLQEIYDRLKRERQSEYCRKGGKYKATVKQRTVASQTIKQVKPWESFKGKSSPVKDRSRSRFNNQIWLKLEFQESSAEDLDRVTEGVSEAIKRFHSRMRQLDLGSVRVDIETTIDGLGCGDRASLTPGITFSYKRVFKVRLSKWKPEDHEAIAALWRHCQVGGD